MPERGEMKVLCACEESQAVCIEFRKLGHEAYSCDIQECSGGHPEWHIQDDIRNVLRHEFTNPIYDLIIAFPPCTHLAVSGARHFEQKRKDGRQQEGINFFKFFTTLKTRKVCIENPVGIMSTHYRKPDQIINPYQFGHMEQKKTCLWLKGLPLLIPTNNVYNEMMLLPKNKRERLHYLPPGINRAKERSKTYAGIAQAMANTWG